MLECKNNNIVRMYSHSFFYLLLYYYGIWVVHNNLVGTKHERLTKKKLSNYVNCK